MVSPHGAGRSPGRASREGSHRSALCRARPALAPQGGDRIAPEAAIRRTLRVEVRPPALRRDEHLLRRRCGKLRDRQAWLLPRLTRGPATGLHRPGGHGRRLPAGLRGLRREHARFADGEERRRVTGTQARGIEPRLGHGPGHGQQRQPRVPARARGAVHRRHAQGDAAAIRAAVGRAELGGGPGRRRCEARSEPGWPGDVPSRAERRSALEGTGDAREVHRPHTNGPGEAQGCCRIGTASRREAGQ